MAKLTTLKRKIGAVKRTHPWTLLDETVPYDGSKFANVLRSNTSMAALKMYQAVIDAVRHYLNRDPQPADLPAYRLACSKHGTSFSTYYLEYQTMKAERIILAFHGNTKKLELSIRDASGNPVSLSSWDQFPELCTASLLLMLPYILDLEAAAGESGLRDVLEQLESGLDEALLCNTKAEFDPATVDSLYYLSIILEVFGGLEVNLSSSGFPEEILDLDTQHPKGAVIAESYPTLIRYVDSTGTTASRYATRIGMTIAEGIAQFSHYSDGRNWTPQERSLIPHFDNPDELLMDEVVELAYAFTQTQGDKNPIVNYEWKGVTSYGKSYGTAQLACILQIPLLRLTADPDMEKSSFLTQILPRTGKIRGIGNLRNSGVFAAEEELEQVKTVPFFAEAVAYLSTQEPAAVDKLMSNSADFYTDAIMDSDYAFEQLTGIADSGTDPTAVFTLYAELLVQHQMKPVCEQVRELKDKVTALKAAGNKDEDEKFITVASPYLRAMSNGYLVELQELSRIRDSGVAVCLNEFDRPNSTIELMDGTIATRHPKALLLVTDNMGYESCRPTDVSVRRRMGGIIISNELTKEQLMSRVKYNTKCTDKVLLDKAYDAWRICLDYCRQNGVTNFCCSASELERLVQMVMHRGMDSFNAKLEECVINKISEDEDVLDAIRGAVKAMVGL